MIQRLKRLTLTGYRGFKELVEIPLDANVVLVFGENGSGKSSVLSGIEYALTGGVRDLQRFTSDYPRSLTHVAYSGTAGASLDVLLADGGQKTIQAGDRSPFSDDIARRHFLEHCYLTQSRLSELISAYREKEEEASTEGLSRFIRELLGLGVLDSVIDGLHESGDIRRFRAAVEEYDELRLEIDRLSSLNAKVVADISRAKTLLKTCIDDVFAMFADLRRKTLKREEIDSSALRKLLHQLRVEEASTGKEGAIDRLRTAEGALQRGKLVLGSPPDGIRDPAEVRDNMSRLRQRERQLLASLQQVVDQSTKLLPNAPTTPPDVVEASRILEQHSREDAQSLADELSAQRRLTRRQGELTKRRNEIANQLEALSDASLQSLGLQEQWSETLRRVVSRIEGDICPVCGRDFSEVSDISLRDHVSSELRQLEYEVSKSAERTRLKLTAEAQLTEVDVELKSIAERIGGLRAPDDLEESLALRQGVEEALVSVRAAREDLELVRSSIASTSDTLTRSEEWYDHRKNMIGELRALATELDIHGGASLPPLQLLEHLTLAVQRLRSATLEGDEGRRQLILKLERALEAALAVEELHNTQEQHQARLRRLENASSAIADLASAAKRVRDISGEVKAVLVRESFTLKLNELWSDVFSRMVRNEWFLPRLDVETLQKGRLQTRMRAAALHDKVQAFDHLESVLSAGNVNTAALSFFLAFNLVVTPINRVLILDDPVQNMDDLHAVELANILRFISRQTGQQLILAIHEEPLLEYLETELGPTTRDQALLTIRLRREGETSVVESSLHVWDGDGLQLSA